MLQGLGGTLNDNMLFEALKYSLDEADKLLLQRTKEEARTLTFAQFWAILKRRF